MALATETTAESVILAAIDKLLPVLRGAFKDLIGLQNDWTVNDINATIAAAMKEDPPADIENTPAFRLYVLGIIFTELFKFLNTPVASIGMTPNHVLNLIYWRNVTPPKLESIAQMPFEVARGKK